MYKRTFEMRGILPIVAVALVAVTAQKPAYGFSDGACPHALKSAASLTPLRPDEISYKLLGDPKAEKTIVLIHGLDSAKETFTPIMESLARKYRVLAYDQRGHGQTVDRGMDFSSTVMANDLKALLDHLGIERATILGHSMGARTAVRFAEMHPDQVESLVIEDMVMFQRAKVQDLDAGLIANLKAIPKEYSSRDALIEELEPIYGDASKSLSYRRARENPGGTVTLLFRPHVSYLYGLQGNMEDLTAAFRSVRVPVLVVRADPKAGAVISKVGAAHLMHLMHSAQVETIEGASHNVHGSKTEEFMAKLTSFLEGKPAGGTKNTAFVAADDSEVFDEVRKMGLAPRGSAVLTNSGRLADSGITAIIHAATGAMKNGPLLEPTLKSVAASVANALKLAQANGHKSVALPFIGGKIFLDRIKVTPEELSGAIVESIIKNNADLTVKIVAFDAHDAELFRRALKAFSGTDNVLVVQGSITDFKTHGCTAIVNAASMELLFGGGVSGGIVDSTGNRSDFDR